MLIIAALSIEAAPLLNALKAKKVLSYSNKTALFTTGIYDILISGLGPVMARRTLEAYLKDHHPDFILNIGTAGMLKDNMEIGKIHHISQAITLNEGPLQLHMLVDEPGDTILSLKRSLEDKELRDYYQDSYKAQLADMECYTLASIAKDHHIPMSAIKITTDFADFETADMFRKHVEESAKKLTEEIMYLIKQ